LQGQYNAPVEPVYLEQNTDVVLLVYKEYKCREDAVRFRYHGPLENNLQMVPNQTTPPSPCSESMMINSTTLAEALSWASTDATGRKKEVVVRHIIKAPYHSLYHDRVAMRAKLSNLGEDHQRVLMLKQVFRPVIKVPTFCSVKV
jgi:hypothetical protein